MRTRTSESTVYIEGLLHHLNFHSDDCCVQLFLQKLVLVEWKKEKKRISKDRVDVSRGQDGAAMCEAPVSADDSAAAPDASVRHARMTQELQDPDGLQQGGTSQGRPRPSPVEKSRTDTRKRGEEGRGGI